MPISHLCPECGFDLAGVRAEPEPHYGLPLVRCPRCPGFSVRVTHPAIRAWRTFLRVKTSLLVLFAQLAALVFLVSMTIFACVGWTEVLFLHPERLSRGDPDTSVVLGFTFLLALAVGAWIWTGLRHWNRLAAWIVFAAVVAGLLSVDVAVMQVIGAVANLSGVPLPTEPFRLDELLPRYSVLTAIMIAATVGIIPGRLFDWTLDEFRARAWRNRRRRLRARSITG